MKNFYKSSVLTVIVLVFSLVFGLVSPITTQAALAPDLGVAAGYSVFGESGIIGGAASAVWGDVGENAFGDGSISGNQAGTYYPAANPGVVSAKLSAYNALFAETPTGSVDLSTVTSVGPGVYTVSASAFNKTLTLTGAGTYVFQRATDIAQTAGGTMILAGGATACNVYWQTSTGMTFAAAGNIEGTIIAGSAITFADSSLTFKGRALAGTNVDLGGITITEPVCGGGGGGGGSFQFPTVVFPLINVTKIPNPLSLPEGSGSVTFTYAVTNVGVIAMRNIIVTDDKCSPTQYVSGDTNGNALLEVGEEWIYRCTKTISETETNIVTAQGSTDNAVVRDTATATVVVSEPIVPPLIHLLKVPNIFLLPAGGGAVTYMYTVTNPGTEPLSNVFIIDDKCTGLPGQVLGHPGDLNQNNLLESNETWSFTCQTNLTQTTTNIGTVQGSANGLTAFDYSSATVAVAPATIIPKLPKTGFPENNTSWNIVLPAGILTILTSLYFVRRKQTA